MEGQPIADAPEGGRSADDHDLDEPAPAHRRSVSDSTANVGDAHSTRRRVRSEDPAGAGSELAAIRNDKEGDEVEGDYSYSEVGNDMAWEESSPKSVNSSSTSRLDASDFSTPSSPMSPESGTLTEEQLSQQQLQRKLRSRNRPIVKGAPKEWIASNLKTPESASEIKSSVPQASQLYGAGFRQGF
jgi:hypothetical protein